MEPKEEEQQQVESRHETQYLEQSERWPTLPYEAWRETCQTLHLWTQIVGKVRMELSPFLNHWWHVTLFVTPIGLNTAAIPYHGSTFEVTFNFLEHTLFIRTSEGTTKALPLIPRSVAPFYQEFMDCLRALGIEVTINTLPSEVQNPIRCDEDEVHASYDPVYARRFWSILAQTGTVMQRYRSPFVGKSSPVHFFWGAFDLAVTLFSGRRVPEWPGVPRFAQEDTTFEQMSCGFWPGNDRFPTPAFYAYTSPAPPGLSEAVIRPKEAFYSHELGEFLLLNEDVRKASSPEQALLEFFRSTYEAGATLGQWDREALERKSV
jgi:Family of unknown function (DUF5996)